VHRDGLVQIMSGNAVGDEVRRFGRRHRDRGAQHNPGQAVAADGRPEQFVVVAVGSEVADVPVGGQQLH
jgi:hypothetical protein